MSDVNETIYACASGPGPSAIAVYRLSGPLSDAVLTSLIATGTLPPLRQAALRRLRDPENGEQIDEALVLRFAKGASYTGEESAEIHVHGGLAVRRSLEAALERGGARLAEPGAFSRRAFLAGRLDLAQAEGVAALIAAETDAQRRQALDVLDGAVGRQAAAWRQELIETAALIETGIDFVEEEIGDDIAAEAARRLARLSSAFQASIADARDMDIDAEKPAIALIGLPNAGKSSLLNAILEQDAAIVSPIAGTTRDTVSGELRLSDVAIRIVDTAGVRETVDDIERIGVARARDMALRADRRILVISADSGHPPAALTSLLEPGDAIFWTKSDLAKPNEAALEALPNFPISVVSTQDRSAARAFDAFIAAQRLGRRAAGSPIAGSERRARLVAAADAQLSAASSALRVGAPEMAAESCRLAAQKIAQLFGAIDHEDVLDALFGRFCIGK